MQKSLLPDALKSDDSFEISAFSQAAEEVGGDYYDSVALKKNLFGLIIGDVSGKGTSAAFNMAQMKGIFHSIAYRKVKPAEFMIQANQALSECLERKSFITASYFWINTKDSLLEFSRAGHVPGLLYEKETETVQQLEDPGMGLGILRNSDYKKYVHSKTLPYRSGDILVLHTDGISEAKNHKNEQFGIERLSESLKKNVSHSIDEITEGIIQDLNTFLHGTKLDDDYTLVIVKFN